MTNFLVDSCLNAVLTTITMYVHFDPIWCRLDQWKKAFPRWRLANDWQYFRYESDSLYSICAYEAAHLCNGSSIFRAEIIWFSTAKIENICHFVWLFQALMLRMEWIQSEIRTGREYYSRLHSCHQQWLNRCCVLDSKACEFLTQWEDWHWRQIGTLWPTENIKLPLRELIPHISKILSQQVARYT